MILRPYQQQSVEAVYSYLRDRDGNPCVVIPTGGGKTPVIATVCRDAVTRWNGRVLILAHVKELLAQAADKLNKICPELDVGVYSAGLRRREINGEVIVAGIQSVYKRACELDAFDLILVDEAHLIPPDGEGMYRKFLADAKVVNPLVRVIGLTATPYRMKSGEICGPENILNEVCYEVGVKNLIHNGYLSPLVSKPGKDSPDTSGLHVRAGEYIASETEELMDTEALVQSACAEIIEKTQDRNKVLIFAAGVDHGQHIVDTFRDEHGIECGFITGETPSGERDRLIEEFKNGDLKYLCNIGVLTTGFDAPNIDCVVLLRPTLSPGLYYQMVGRGLRLFPGKKNCLILDYGGNVMLHGPIDEIEVRSSKPRTSESEAPAKECPECQSLIATSYRRCPDCGFEFPDPMTKKHEAIASKAGVLSGQTSDETFEVIGMTYSVHEKKGSPKSMRVDYRTGLQNWQSEWICFEHNGYARQKAEYWWKQRCLDPVPDTAQQAVDLAEAGCLAETTQIVVRSTAGEKYDRIISYDIGEIPDPGVAWAVQLNFDEDDVPF
ncbi:DEAD/DEAH box helicase [Gimesia fumaroli]|uniref:Type I restriction enzyme EcoKI subunit R n=1 Tax=Gimesia fumaroli TaxID=2527976 RepID=A0A518IKV5_9PLAN|nr:DEAD/DEAH box helicase [Gimesia fumaroli]QDV53719.1 type I restriction enzyme EcoKI subunit R [Gimesia fumaroli]